MLILIFLAKSVTIDMKLLVCYLQQLPFIRNYFQDPPLKYLNAKAFIWMVVLFSLFLLFHFRVRHYDGYYVQGFEYSVFCEWEEDRYTDRVYKIYSNRFSYALYGPHMEWHSLKSGNLKAARVSILARRGIGSIFEGSPVISKIESLEYFSSSHEDMKPFLDLYYSKESK